jgi:cob(I)alamin adenosyltransferase
MKIYTKTGDAGSTSLFGGQRVLKSHERIDAYGTMDELNAHIGMLRDQDVNKPVENILIEIQNKLFTIGSILATEPGNKKVKVPSLNEADIELLEKEIDSMDKVLPPIKNFVLPGGHPAVSFGHIARTVCRRAERLVVALDAHEKVDPLVVKYLNRLSDYLFVLCRKIASDLGITETPWRSNL